jgi:hypothetical protein
MHKTKPSSQQTSTTEVFIRYAGVREGKTLPGWMSGTLQTMGDTLETRRWVQRDLDLVIFSWESFRSPDPDPLSGFSKRLSL